MSDKMTQITPAGLLDWILEEKKQRGTVFGVNQLFYADANKTLPMFSGKLETPFGPAAGPHTQLAQNIIAAYAGGARFFELKTVQTLDGEDLPVQKPCIRAEDECYNVEWSTELYVPQALEEYVKAWFFCKLLAKEYGFGNPDGFVFNMSVGYDYEGITSKKIDDFIEGLRDAHELPVWKDCADAARARLPELKNVDGAYIDSISPNVCESITLSTLHGCPPQEIERIAAYLINEKGLNTYVKCNPTLLGYEYARETLDALGFDYIVFDDHHFKEDLQYEDAVPMLRRLIEQAEKKGVCFGVKLTNTFPVDSAAGELPGGEMYMSGRSLYPLTISVAEKLSRAFDGKLRVSMSGGADAFNITPIVRAGVWPVTIATTLLKAGGYNRLRQIAEELYALPYHERTGVDVEAVDALKKEALTGDAFKKSIKPLPSRKTEEQVPLTDCFFAPCESGCPIHQDIPAYVALAGEGKYLEALRLITEKNPLPFMTGTICSHRCMDKCTRNFYEESVKIRDTKLLCAQKAMDALLKETQPPEKTGERVAVVGGGAAGMAAAFFLAREGMDVTLFEKKDALGGIVRHVVPAFRVPAEVVERDEQLLRKMGVTILTDTKAPSVDTLKKQGFAHIVLAVGAYQPGTLRLEKGEAVNVLDFLAKFRADQQQGLGKNVVVVGGGNTAMDAARAAKRADGVENVYIVYRRTKRYMPADEEELQLAIADGVEFMELLSPKAHENGTLICHIMKLGAPDKSGRRGPVPTEETVLVPADTVIAAVGERVDGAALAAQGIKVDDNGRALVDATLMTSVENVYIVGDAQRGPATVVEAIADARAAANAITGKYAVGDVSMMDGKERGKKGILLYSKDAQNEAQRCLKCNVVCESCVDVCPNRANISVISEGRPQIVHVDKLCNECGNCETFCPYASAPYKDKFTLFADAAGFSDSENEGFLILANGRFRVRLDGDEFDTDGADAPQDLAALMRAVADNYWYLV